MTDEELLNHEELHELTEEQLIRRGWLIQKQNAKTEGQRELADWFLERGWEME